MFKHYFEIIKDIDIYPVIALILFLIFFIAVIIWISRADKKYFTRMEHIPFDNFEIKDK